MTPSQFEVPEIATVASLLPAYEIEHLIAESETGAIYKAHQISLERDVAIKVLPLELASDPLIRQTFEMESRAMAGLNHTNVIRVFDNGEADGMPYRIMEYVPGKSLGNSSRGVAVDPKQATDIIDATCEGLTHAHARGIAHGSINPSNILLTTEVTPKINNVGGLVNSNSAKTSAYLAPETTNDPSQVHTQSDIFAIGVIFQELLTGTVCGSEEFYSTAVADTKLAAICAKATCENPGERYQDCSELTEALKLWKDQKPVRKLATSPAAGSYRPSLAKKSTKVASTKVTVTTPSNKWSLFKHCAAIAILFCAISVVWGMYQDKQATLARLQAEQDSKYPTIRIIHLDDEPAADHRSSRSNGPALAATGID